MNPQVLRAARIYRREGVIPLSLAARLMADGYDVGALEEDFERNPNFYEERSERIETET